MAPESTRQPDRMHLERVSHVLNRDPLHAVRMKIFQRDTQPRRPLIGVTPRLRDAARRRDDLQAQALDAERRRGV